MASKVDIWAVDKVKAELKRAIKYKKDLIRTDAPEGVVQNAAGYIRGLQWVLTADE